jgi:very-short-patch-repair endonuclease
MSAQRTPLPSPLAGEGAERQRREAGEGAVRKNPSPGRSLRSRPPSPAGGEGTEIAAQSSVKSKAVQRARQLRKRMTDAEAKLWFALRDRRFSNFKFRRQAPVGPYFPDFVCFDVRVIVEVDGGQHADSKSDTTRDKWFTEHGFTVLRYWNNDVLQNLEGVLTALVETLQKREGRAA